MKKLLSLLLTLAISAGAVFLPGVANAQVSAQKTLDFSALNTESTEEQIKEALGALGTWSYYGTESGGSLTIVDFGDVNGSALCWSANGTGTSYDDFFRFSVDQNLDSDAVNTQAWMSFDFRLEGNGLARKISFFDSNSRNTIWGGILETDKNANYLKVNSANTGKTIVDNAWHTLELCLEKTGDAASNLRVFLDGILVAEKAYDNVRPFGVVQMEQYGAQANTKWYFDNMKFWKQDKTDDSKEEIIYQIGCAKDLTDNTRVTVPAGVTVSDVGKGTIRVEAAEGGSANSLQIAIADFTSFAVTKKKDLLLEWSMKADDWSWRRNIGGMVSSSNEVLTFLTNGAVNNWGDTTTKKIVMPLHQFNHYAMRIKNDGTTRLYVNGVEEWAHLQKFFGTNDVAFQKLFIWTEYKGSASTVPACATEISNYKLRYVDATKEIGDILTPQVVYRNYDFSDIENNVTDYQTLNESGTAVKAAPDISYANVAETYGNTNAIFDGFAGKTAADKVMKLYSTTDGFLYKDVKYCSDKSMWGSTNAVEPGATIRGGASVLFDDASFDSASSNRKRLVLSVYPQNAVSTTTRAERELCFASDGIYLVDSTGAATGTKVASGVLRNKWYRVDYVLQAGANGQGHTVDFYLDGKLLTETPLPVVYDYPSGTTQGANDPIAKILFSVVNEGSAAFYADDLTFEYIPASVSSEREISKELKLQSSADKLSLHDTQGVLAAIDKADSQFTVAQIKDALCNSDDVTVVNSAGASVADTALAADNYAVLSRKGLPSVFYRITDLDITATKSAVTAELPYDGNKNAVLIVALYNHDNQLLDCVIDTAEDGNLSVSQSVTEGAESYKVYFWNSTDGMKPYYESVDGAVPTE